MQTSGNKGPWWFDHQGYVRRTLFAELDAAIHLIAQQRGVGRLVDFGCGEGWYASAYTAAGFRYEGWDLPSPDSPRGVRHFEDGKRLPIESNSVDVVSSIQVLEHVWDIDWYLSEAQRILGPNGRLLLSTHGAWLYHPHPDDFRRWTRPGLIREVEQRGFEVTECRSVLGPLAWSTQIRLLGLHTALAALPALQTLARYTLYPLYSLRIWIEDKLVPTAIRHDHACFYLLTCRKRD